MTTDLQLSLSIKINRERVIAFEKGEKSDRAFIIAYLRGPNAHATNHTETRQLMREIADSIEAGEHHFTESES